MRAGKLDRTVTIEREVLSVELGDAFSSWLIVTTVRAELIQASANEAATGYGEAETDSCTFRIRWPSYEITTANRVSLDGVAYNIKRIVEIGRRRGLELTCERIAGANDSPAYVEGLSSP